MTIVNHTKLSKLNFPKTDRQYLLKIAIGQCEYHLLYMLILSFSNHSYQHANQTLRSATPNSIRNTAPADFVTTQSVLTIHSILKNQFLKEFSDNDVAQIFMDTLEKSIKDIFKKFKFPKDMIMTRHDELV